MHVSLLPPASRRLQSSFRESGTHGRRVHLHAARATHQVELKLDQLGRTIAVGFGANAEQAVAQSPFERAERLPFEAVHRVAGRMSLRDGAAAELPSGVVVVALRARHVELALPLLVERLSGGGIRLHGDW